MIPFSVLDLSPIPAGGTASDALVNSLALVKQAERLGFTRYWVAEHHNMPGIASAATAVVVGHLAGGTKTIRVGSGGVMLPNHAPLVIAEQFGTLAALYPGRIDLGLGRAPGTDPITARALRRDLMGDVDRFPDDVQELQAYFADKEMGQRLRAIPGAGQEVPLWLLGSSTYSAQLAAALGLPFAFASHFAPDYIEQALALYRTRFRPSAQLAKPHAMITVNVVVADSDADAEYHFTSQQQSFVNLRRGKPSLVPAPINSMSSYWSSAEKAQTDHALAFSFIGGKTTVANGLDRLLATFQPDELMITAHIHNQLARLRSLKIVAEIRNDLRPATLIQSAATG